MLRYLTIADPTRSTTGTDLWRSLLLYHEFGSSAGSTTSEKLNRLGMIQGIWHLTRDSNHGDEPDDMERVIELDDEVILVIQVESRFLICCSVCQRDEEKNDDTGKSIPYQFYLAHLWLSYRFFVLLFGEFSKFENSETLTDVLNEHFVPFWSDVFLKPELLVRRGVEVLWHNAYKVAELGLPDETSERGNDESDTDPAGQSEDLWELLINKEILLQEENYLGIKDILVYHLPQDHELAGEEQPKRRIRGAKSYGFVKNFAIEFESLPDISNWIYHLHSAYGHLSAHVLAGSVHYKEKPATEIAQTVMTNRDNVGQQPSIDGNSESGTHLDETPSLGKRLFDTIALPVSLAYDAVHEVSETTGVSGSLNFLRDHIPHWSSTAGNPSTSGEDSSGDHLSFNLGQGGRRYGFLISPLALEALPMNYKVRKLYLKINRNQDFYSVLFWYYEDILVVVVCDPKFDMIWDRNYLNDLSYTLSRSMEQLYANVLRRKNPKMEMFSYLVVDKIKDRVLSSLPRCYQFPDPTGGKSTKLELVSVPGSDLLSPLGLFDDRNSEGDAGGYQTILSSIDVVASLFKGNRISKKGSKPQTHSNFISYKTFLDSLESSKQWQLQKAVLSFIESLGDVKVRADMTEEKFLTLGNGILCYLKEDDSYFMMILKDWLDERTIEEVRKGSRSGTLFASLGSDVMAWWAQISDR